METTLQQLQDKCKLCYIICQSPACNVAWKTLICHFKLYICTVQRHISKPESRVFWFGCMLYILQIVLVIYVNALEDCTEVSEALMFAAFAMSCVPVSISFSKNLVGVWGCGWKELLLLFGPQSSVHCLSLHRAKSPVIPCCLAVF